MNIASRNNGGLFVICLRIMFDFCCPQERSTKGPCWVLVLLRYVGIAIGDAENPTPTPLRDLIVEAEVPMLLPQNGDEILQAPVEGRNVIWRFLVVDTVWAFGIVPSPLV